MTRWVTTSSHDGSWLALIAIPWVATVVACISLEAQADQCLVVPLHQAQRAVERLSVGSTALAFCEPCGDLQPSHFPVRKTWLTEYDQGDSWEVVVNGRSIDLAYTYIQNESVPDALPEDEGSTKKPANAPTLWRNLGSMVGCQVDAVSLTVNYFAKPLDHTLEKPPNEALRFDITQRSYQGIVFRTSWTASRQVDIYDAPQDDSTVLSRLAPGDSSTMVQVLSIVQPARVDVVFDEPPFNVGEVLYILHLWEDETYRMWHYGSIRQEPASYIDRFRPFSDVQTCPEPSSVCWGVAKELPKETWWAQIEIEPGVGGWVPQPLVHFEDAMSGPSDYWPDLERLH